jgi:hypothetical protein
VQFGKLVAIELSAANCRFLAAEKVGQGSEGQRDFGRRGFELCDAKTRCDAFLTL